ncbi:MAG TPA: hypothetical protein VK781_07640, partial [Solirubrobacteraceae bacterium]|nr:hypothetical protein [Solirubrobacteraceae bacterium]
RLEHRGDDIAACFLLEDVLLEGGYEQVFHGEVTGLIGAGAFIAFGPVARERARPRAKQAKERAPEGGSEDMTPGLSPEEPRKRPIYEGMLPVRLLSAGETERDWWTLNEQGTILRGERSGATLRLGDQIDVRVVRVDASGGRVDLAPAG